MSQVREGNVIIPRPIETTSEERTIAALTHASSLLTLLVGFGTFGLGGVIFAFVPFLIYLSYKDRSKFVAFQAAQAFALQILGTVGWFVALIVGTVAIALVLAIITALSFILIGLILWPVAAIVIPVFCIALIGAPFVGMAFAVVSSIEVMNGRNYSYPYVGPWVEDWLKRQETTTTPAV
jgi:uncharacterized Tic20 family protein